MAAIVVIIGLSAIHFFAANVVRDSTPTVITSPESNPIKNDSIELIPTQKLTNNQPFLQHFPYAETNLEKLIIIGSYGRDEYQRFEQLNQEAAQKLMELIYAARTEGIWIIVISGFRTIQQQQILWKAQVKKLGSEQQAAKFNAPPGYSEHHTGYAVDLGDGQFPNLDLTTEFENTTAFQWLKIHAQEYGFEMSFPPNNSQGISYEPWHWRFIGSPEAKTIFAGTSQF
ncbi:MAG: M15 family metallopeptidase [Trichodesmium sp. MO_231.B1]|nr:M15 family metallopeptidase [Trichodesmium sp. MO_231.B1]